MTDPHTSSSAGEWHPEAQERRAWIRAASDFSQLWVRTGDQLITECLILDESVGGMSLEVADAGIFEIGREVELSYASIPMKATVRSCIERTDGRYRVGLQWRD